MGLLLFFIARLLQIILTPIFFLYAIFRIFHFKQIGEYFHNVAFSIDQLGNTMGASIMNDVLLKKDPVKKYGNPDETISHVTGVNYLGKKLTWTGLIVAKTLNRLDKNHVENAAINEQ